MGKRRFIMMLLTISACSLTIHASSQAQSNSLCMLTDSQRAHNRSRIWSDFEFSTDEMGGPMAFNSERCWQAAVDASEDYLANGPILSVREQAITLFHMARNLARTGDHRGAARLAAAARRSDQQDDAPLDWNSYVTGFHAYLSGHRNLLSSMIAQLKSHGGQGNLTNANVLERAERCFDEPFLVVEESPQCAVEMQPTPAP